MQGSSRKLIEVLTTHDGKLAGLPRTATPMARPRYLPTCPQVTVEYERFLSALLQ